MQNASETKSKSESPSRELSQKSLKSASSPNVVGPTAVPFTAGNQAMQRLLTGGMIQAKLNVSHPGDEDEVEADQVADQVMSSAPVGNTSAHRKPVTRAERSTVSTTASGQPMLLKRQANRTLASGPPGQLSRPSGGERLSHSTRAFFEPRFGYDFSDVRVHTGNDASQSASAIKAKAFTTGPNIVFGAGEYSPDSPSGMRLIAHELTHTLQPQPDGGRLRRETAQEVIDLNTDMLGTNLNEEQLAAELVTMARAGRYSFVVEVINALSWSDRDDVATEMMDAFSNTELIEMARNTSAVEMLRRMKEELGDWWGWTTGGEGEQVNLLGAVLDDPGQRFAWNRARIRTLKDEAGTDLEALARMFEDDQIIDDGTVTSRLQAILSATEHIVIPGLQTGVDFGDTGFAGEPTPGGPGFRDPHPSSQNQVGHFLTAAGLQFSPGVVSRPIPVFGSIRSMVGAPAGMSDSEVALRLTIGHEKRADPIGAVGIFTNILLTGFIENLLPGPEGESEEERDRRIGRAIEAETRRQIAEVIAAFRAQFLAATDDDVAAWNEAIAALGTGSTVDLAAAEGPLGRIAIDPSQRGNSIQDLRLSLIGWRLGQMISAGEFGDNAAVATWIRANVGAPPPP